MYLRAWEEKDLPAICKAEQNCFTDPWTREMLFDCLRYPYYHTFLAEEGGQVCGYGVLIVLFEDAEVANIAVDRGYRGQGVAKALLQAMHEKAKALGATRILLEVRKSNAAALSLYEGFGYQVYGERKGYYEDGEDALLMERGL